MSEAIRITGLREFTRGLKKMDSELPKEVRLALNEVADLVIQKARPGIPSRTGRARSSLRAQSTRSAVRVAAGGRKAPYYPWLDFGGRVGRRKSINRPYRSDGRYLYPAYHDLRDRGELTDALSEALTKVAHSAGIEVD